MFSCFLSALKKKVVIQKIIEKLRRELSLYDKAARAAHAEATHEQSKAENKYDTRGLEASYLARGQSRQAAELIAAIEQFEKLSVRDFAGNDLIDLGAVVEIQQGGEKNLYILGPRSGGTEVVVGKKEFLVITPFSPLGQKIVGKRLEELKEFVLPGSTVKFSVNAIW